MWKLQGKHRNYLSVITQALVSSDCFYHQPPDSRKPTFETWRTKYESFLSLQVISLGFSHSCDHRLQLKQRQGSYQSWRAINFLSFSLATPSHSLNINIPCNRTVNYSALGGSAQRRKKQEWFEQNPSTITTLKLIYTPRKNKKPARVTVTADLFQFVYLA